MKKYIAVVGERCPEMAVESLLALSETEEVIMLPRDTMIAEPVCDHPDSLIFVFDGVLYTHKEYAKTAKRELSYICKKCALELCSINCERGCAYPLDCGFNALSLPDRNLVIGREKSLAEPLKKLPLANTNQGYAGCTALYIGSTVITADPSIAKTCKSFNVPVYMISGKGISLPGYNEGFIGGAGGTFENTVCLFGSAEYSESAREVELFCKMNSIKPVFLENGILTDRGGIKFIPID